MAALKRVEGGFYMMTKPLAQIAPNPASALWLAISCVALLLVVGCATSPPEAVAPTVSARTTTQVEPVHPPLPTPAEYKVLVEKNREAKRAFLIKLKKYIEEDGGDPERLNELFGGTGKVLSSPWFKEGVKYRLSTPPLADKGSIHSTTDGKSEQANSCNVV